jgi:hypothetical protein
MAEFREGWTGTIRFGDGPDIPVDNMDLTIERVLAALRPEWDGIRAGGLHAHWSAPVNDDAIEARVMAFGAPHVRWTPRARDATRAPSPAEALARLARLRTLGVDPDRVIDGETVRKEIDDG